MPSVVALLTNSEQMCAAGASAGPIKAQTSPQANPQAQDVSGPQANYGGGLLYTGKISTYVVPRKDVPTSNPRNIVQHRSVNDQT